MIRPCHGYQAILGVVGGQRGLCEATHLTRALLARTWLYAGRNPKWAWGAALAMARCGAAVSVAPTNGSALTMAQRVGLRADRAAAEAALDDRTRAETAKNDQTRAAMALDRRSTERAENVTPTMTACGADPRFQEGAVVGAWLDEIA